MVAILAVLLGGIGAFCGALVNVLVSVNLAAAATAHVSRDAAARFLVTSFSSGFEHVFSSVYFVGIFAGPVLMGVALWRSRSVPRWLAVLFVIGLEVAQQAHPRDPSSWWCSCSRLRWRCCCWRSGRGELRPSQPAAAVCRRRSRRRDARLRTQR
jgi:hypothetical protein